MAEKNQPHKKFRAGLVTCTIWENENKTSDGEKFKSYSFDLQRSYKDGKDWKNTNSMRKQDIAYVEEVLAQARTFLLVKQETNEDD